LIISCAALSLATLRVFKAVEKPVYVHHLHATILHLTGIGHTKLACRFGGRDFPAYRRLRNVITGIIA